MTQKNILNFFGTPSSPVSSTDKKNSVMKAKVAASVPLSTLSKSPIEEDGTNANAKIFDLGNLPYAALCEIFEEIENTTKRLLIHDLLKDYFVPLLDAGAESQLLYSIYLCLNRVGPLYEGLELGIGESILMKAVAASTGKTLANVKAQIEKLGDLGKVVESSRQTQSTMIRPKPLTLTTVFKTLREIALTTGSAAVQRKMDKIQFLLVSCQNNEAKYLIRSLEGKLRIGLAEQSLLIALAQASVISWKNRGNDLSGSSTRPENYFDESVAMMKSVYSELPVYERILPALIKYGIFDLDKHCHMTPGIPIKPMLAHPTKALTEVLDRFEQLPFTCEYKYDGERAQVHLCEDGRIFVASRNLENMSEKYPDITQKMNLVKKDPSVRTFVLDCEAVAWDSEERKILPFQVLSTRKRKDVLLENITVQICLFAFDLLYLNGESLLKQTFAERRKALHSLFEPLEGHFQFAKYMDSESIEDIQTFLDDSIKDGCEGLMVKTLQEESSYEPSKRSRNWLKVKKDYLSGAGDSLDLVVIGAYYGRGKRTGVYGGYLLACYDDENEVYQAICKIGTGFSEADLERHEQEFKGIIIPSAKAYYQVTDSIKPDVWFDTVQVWEVKAADFSISPIYTAARGIVDKSKGISLRFPRFIRLREDKTPEQATTASMIADLYKSQTLMSQDKNIDKYDEDDY